MRKYASVLKFRLVRQNLPALHWRDTMRDMSTSHQRLQELCDCFAETDPLFEMAALPRDEDKEEAALKWLALAVLHGIDYGAEAISLETAPDGSVAATVEYRPRQLPSPGGDIGGRIVDAVRDMTHIEGRKGQTPFAVGIRDSSVEIRIKVKEKDGAKKITLKFPDVWGEPR